MVSLLFFSFSFSISGKLRVASVGPICSLKVTERDVVCVCAQGRKYGGVDFNCQKNRGNGGRQLEKENLFPTSYFPQGLQPPPTEKFLFGSRRRRRKEKEKTATLAPIWVGGKGMRQQESENGPQHKRFETT